MRDYQEWRTINTDLLVQEYNLIGLLRVQFGPARREIDLRILQAMSAYEFAAQIGLALPYPERAQEWKAVVTGIAGEYDIYREYPLCADLLKRMDDATEYSEVSEDQALLLAGPGQDLLRLCAAQLATTTFSLAADRVVIAMERAQLTTAEAIARVAEECDLARQRFIAGESPYSDDGLSSSQQDFLEAALNLHQVAHDAYEYANSAPDVAVRHLIQQPARKLLHPWLKGLSTWHVDALQGLFDMLQDKGLLEETSRPWQESYGELLSGARVSEPVPG